MSATFHGQPPTDPGPYSPLRPDEIRLLNLTAENRNASANQGKDNAHAFQIDTELGVALSFETVSLRYNTFPEFTALSYAWGDPEDTLPTYVSGCPLTITRNLRAILRCLAVNEEPQRLWIDALCINQLDIAERAEQVGHMRDIYSRASSVLVFLSPESIPFDVGLRFLEQAAARPEAHYEPSLYPHIIVDGLDAQSETLRDSVIAFFAAPWWTRVWTVQEFVLARRVVFQCGQRCIDGPQVLAAFRNLREHETGCCWSARRASDGNARGYLDVPSLPNGGLSLFHATLRLDNLQVMVNSDEDGMSDMLMALCLFRTRNCSNHRDRIFGMLGLNFKNGGISEGIKTDYTIPTAMLFENATTSIIQQSNTLDVLSHILRTSGVHEKTPELPSWVPDWNASLEESFHLIYLERISRVNLYNASGHMKLAWQLESPGKVATKALFIGNVWKTVPGYPRTTEALSGKKLLDQWGSIARYCSNTPQFLGEEDQSSNGAGFQNLLSGSLTLQDWEQDSLNYSKAYEAWYHWFTHDEPGSLSPETRHDARKFDNLVQQTCLGRVCFSTEDGQIGFAPEVTRKGDVVVIIPGGKTPYLLRKTQPQSRDVESTNTYEVLGDAYIHGAMSGEKIRSLASGDALGFENILLV
ncbi:Fc.00g057100.m01.CDS01 [Cosmosporella sp. VM-42]